MKRFLSPALRTFVAVALAASPALAQFEVRAAPEAGVVAPAAGAFAAAPLAAPRSSSPLSAPALTPALSLPFSAAASPAAVAAPAAAAIPAAALAVAAAEAPNAAAAVAAPLSAPAAESAAARSVVADRSRPAFSSVAAAARPAALTDARHWGRFFDGGARAAAADDVPAAAILSPGRAAALAPAAVAARSAVSAVPAPRTSRSRASSRAALAVAVAVLVLAAATPAFAATTAAAPFTAQATLSVIAALHPAASAVGAVVGALYGMITAKRADGAAPNSGDVFASTMRYGVLGGAGVYVLLDLAQSAFTGFSATALNPLSTALATAALGHTAFEGKFSDPATTSADRIMSVFPAVAAAMGLTVNTLLGASLASWPVALHSLAAGAMSATGLAAALYAAFYAPGRSAASGPARMAKGWVLQSLMAGLAFAVGSPWLSVPFALLAVWGFADAMFASGQELWSAAKAFLGRWTTPPAPPTPPTPPKS